MTSGGRRGGKRTLNILAVAWRFLGFLAAREWKYEMER